MGESSDSACSRASRVLPNPRCDIGPFTRVTRLVHNSFGTQRGLVRFLLGEVEYVVGRVEPYLQPSPEKIRRLVFVCLGNINRSAFAAANAARLGARCASFGLASSNGLPAFHSAIRIAPLFGIDLSGHRTTDVSSFEYADGDLLVTMEIRHARLLETMGHPSENITLLGHWSHPHRLHIHDPHTLSEDYFKTCFTIIQSGVVNLVDFLHRGGSECVPR